VSRNRRVVPVAAPVRVYGGPIMRTTVGSLPSAVYWRRRAVVLGAVLLSIIVLFVSCSGNDNDDKRAKGTANSQAPTPAPATSTSAEPDTTFGDGAQAGAPSRPNPADLLSQQPGDDEDGGDDSPATSQPTAGTGTGANTNITVPSDGSCADTEIAVQPVAAQTTVKRGTPMELQLVVKNIGSRACTRDVGADPQELYLEAGAFKYWSSDSCSPNKNSNVLLFAAGQQRSYSVTWNGRQSTSCANSQPTGPAPPRGQFQLRARLGTLVSNPITLTLLP
jgi:hypothetical protein